MNRERTDSVIRQAGETIGFLSRWCLLAVVGAMGAVVGWVAIASAVSVADRVPPLVVSDEIFEPRPRRNSATAYLLVPAAMRICPEFLYTLGDDEPRFVHGSKGKMRAVLANQRYGLHKVRLVGIGYSRFAFETYEAICKFIPSTREVFAVDGRLFDPEARIQPAEMAEIVRQLQTRGEVVFIHPGPLADYRDSRLRLRAGYPEVPYVFATRPSADHMDSLRHLGWAIGRRGHDKPPFITADGELAQAAAGEGFKTHWVSTQEVFVPTGLQLMQHALLESFRKWLVQVYPESREQTSDSALTQVAR